ncbi:MAG: TolC family protein, partial [Gemmobacter sp.]
AAGLAAGGRQPRPRLAPDVGIPADLLRNRPDIRAAERRYYAALADVGVARAALYPRLSLTGTIALTARSLGTGGADYLFGPVLAFPVLPDGSARAGVEAAHARARAAHGAWKSAVLTALVEVETALIDYRAVTAAEASAARAAGLWREALDQTRRLAAAGEATLSDLIDAEGALSAAETALTEAAWRRAAAFATLNIRLGAGHGAGHGAGDRPRPQG